MEINRIFNPNLRLLPERWQQFRNITLKIMKLFSSYLIPNRLSDLIRLISVLGIHEEFAFRKNDGLEKTLNGKPRSGKEWFDIAKEHPEFFKLNTDTNSITLLVRFLNRKPNGQKFDYPALSSIETQKLVDQAIVLHDKQISRFQLLIPVYLAILALIVNLIPHDNGIDKLEKKIDNLVEIVKKK
jgi:hypothetical protein